MKKYWFIFHQSDVMLEKRTGGVYTIPYAEQPPLQPDHDTTVHVIDPFPDAEVRTFRIDSPCENVLPAEKIGLYEMCPLRSSYYKISYELYLKAGKCQEILYWDSNTRYCGVCGAPMRLNTNISKQCTHCGREVWPQLATAVIVLIHKGDEVLLVHARNFRGNFYGLVAGFVETGENLEQAVEREVMEETGLSITNLRYFASQPWPYPCGLMVGFHADYLDGDICLQQSELSSGGWFRDDNLPQLPEKLSIARKLIDDWLQKKSRKS